MTSNLRRRILALLMILLLLFGTAPPGLWLEARAADGEIEEAEIPAEDAETAETATSSDEAPEAGEETLPEEPVLEEPAELQVETPEIQAEPAALQIEALETMALAAAAASTSTETLADENYNIKYLIQSGYQMVCFGNATINQHTMGSVLVQGNLNETNASGGIADSGFSVKPSYVGGKVTGNGQGFNHASQQHPVQPLYVGSAQNTVTCDDSGQYSINGRSNYNNGGVIAYNDGYINWSKLYSAMTSLSGTLASGGTKSYASFYDWQEISDIQAGSSVTFTNLGTSKVKLRIQGSSANFTVITILDSGTVYVPEVLTYNGQQLDTTGDNADMPILFNFPNATNVVVPADLTPSFGHILAPKADVDIQGGNYNGIVICQNMTASGEGHIRNYHGDLPTPKTYPVKVWKVDDSTGGGLAGASLRVTDGSGSVVAEFVSTAVAESLNLPAGNYTLTETAAPDGYKVAASIGFTVTDSGTVTVGGAAQSAATVTMRDARSTFVRVKKTDLAGNLLPGAKLEIRTGSQTVYSFVSSGETAEITLEPGNYTLVETEAPAGYLVAEPIPFQVLADGTVTVNGQAASDLTVAMADKPQPYVVVRKEDPNGTMLAGAELVIETAAGETVLEFTTDGSDRSIKLLAGEYILRETAAPEGFKLAEPLEFQVFEDGTVTAGGEPVQDLVLRMVDAVQPKILVQKVDESGAPLSGATLRIETMDGAEIDTFVTDGTVHETKLDAGAYVLLEAEAPAGYALAAAIEFTVAADGTVTVDGEAAEDVTLVMRDELAPASAALEAGKVLEHGRLAGGDFRFTLTGIPAETTTTETVEHPEETETVTTIEESWERSASGPPGFPYYDTTQWRWVPSGWDWRSGYWEHKVQKTVTTTRVIKEGYTETITSTAYADAPMPEGSEGQTKTAVNARDGTVSFGTIQFTEPGVYRYKITEEIGSYLDDTVYITYDQREFYAAVTVTRGPGGLEAAVEYLDGEENLLEGPPEFRNIQMPMLIFRKVNLAGGVMKPEEYRSAAFHAEYIPPGGTEVTEVIPLDLSTGSGYMLIEKPRPGTYRIYEDSAPEGYMKLSEPIEVTLDEQGNIGLVQESIYAEITDYVDEVEGCTYENVMILIKNYPNIVMPETGVFDHPPWYLLGLGLILAGGAMLLKNAGEQVIPSRRKKTRVINKSIKKQEKRNKTKFLEEANTMKRRATSIVMAFVLVTALVLGMGISAFATDTGSVAITNAKEGNVYTAYQVMAATIAGQDSDGNDLYTYEVNAAFKAFFDGKPYGLNEQNEITITRDGGAVGTLTDDGRWKNDNTTEAAALAAALAAYAKEKGIAGTAVSADAQNLDIGFYVIAETESGKSEGNEVATKPILVSLTKDGATDITLKDDTTKLDKVIVESDGDVKSNNVNIGDSIDYKVTTKIPTYEANVDPEKLSFVLTDTFSAGLTYNANSLNIEGFTEGTDYTVKQEDQVLTITFEPEAIYNNQGKAVVLTYSATLNDKAVVDSTDGNPNTIRLDYTNNPNQEDSYKTLEDKVITYTYGFNIHKVDKAAPSDDLEDAKFAIYTVPSGTEGAEPIGFVVKDGVYVPVGEDYDGEDVVYEVTTGKDGLAAIKGLDEGTYYIKETKAPDGFTVLTEDVIVTITDNGKDGTKSGIATISAGGAGDAETEGGTAVYDEAGNKTGNVENNDGTIDLAVLVKDAKGISLPETGAMTALYCMIGGVLIVLLGAGYYFLGVRRKSAAK